MLKKCCKDHQFESTHCGFVAPGEDSGASDEPGDTVRLVGLLQHRVGNQGLCLHPCFMGEDSACKAQSMPCWGQGM